MLSPVVSVVVPSRGGAARLPVLMEALAGQSIEQPWEVIVVLDGDIDDSSRVVASYADRLPLRVITRSSSAGVAAALADGYAAARGIIVIRCDDDLTPQPDFVARHLRWHQERPADAAPLGVMALTRDVFDDSPYATAYGRPANERALAAAYARPAAQRWMHWAACNSVPKAAYEAAGGFDTSMTYREDSELGLRLAESGVELIIDPALEIEHRGPARDVATRAARAFTSGASTKAFAERHPDSADPAHIPRSLWDRAVARTARRLRSREDAERFGRRIDVALPMAPAPLRGKLVAWAVEASGSAGRSAGRSDWVRAGESSIGRAKRSGTVAIFVPGVSSGGGAEKTALCMATALRDLGLRVTCFTDSEVDPSQLSAHFGLDLTAVAFECLPAGPALPRVVPQALRDIARDRRHGSRIKRARADLFVNIKYKSSLPGLGRRNWYYIHFPHRLEVAPTSTGHGRYLSTTTALRRAALHPRSSSFRGTYDEFFANSEFTAAHASRRWGVTATTMYPPCDSAPGSTDTPHERILISVGRFQAPGENVPHKNQHALIEAFRELPDLIAQGWRLHLVGALSSDPADRAYHARLVEATTDLPVTITANASHAQLVDLLERSSIYWHAQGLGTDADTHPEAQEHFGISTAEAMAWGVIPLVYASAGPLEVVAAVSTGLSWTTPRELVERTRDLATTDDLDLLRKQCAARATDFSRDAFRARVQQAWSVVPERGTRG